MNLLLDDRPLVILPSLAKALGNLNEAVFLQQLHYLIEVKKQSGKDFIDGRFWVFNSQDEWLTQFIWMSKKTLQRTITGLVSKGLVIKGSFNLSKLDHTCWYTIDYERLKLVEQQSDAGLAGKGEQTLLINQENSTENNSLLPSVIKADSSFDTSCNQKPSINNTGLMSPKGQNDLIASNKGIVRCGHFDLFDRDGLMSPRGQNDLIEEVKMTSSKRSKWPHRNSDGINIKSNQNNNNLNINYILPKTTTIETTTTGTTNDTTEDRASPPVDVVDDVLSAYHELCPSFPRALSLTAKRRRMICALLDDGFDISMIRQAFRTAEASDFLTGRNSESGWRRFDFDWLLLSSNLVSVLEGKYDNMPVGQRMRVEKHQKKQQAMEDYLRSDVSPGGSEEITDETLKSLQRRILARFNNSEQEARNST